MDIKSEENINKYRDKYDKALRERRSWAAVVTDCTYNNNGLKRIRAYTMLTDFASVFIDLDVDSLVTADFSVTKNNETKALSESTFSIDDFLWILIAGLRTRKTQYETHLSYTGGEIDKRVVERLCAIEKNFDMIKLLYGRAVLEKGKARQKEIELGNMPPARNSYFI